MRRVLLATRAPDAIILIRLWLALEFALDGVRALGINYHLGSSRVERYIAPMFGGHLSSKQLAALACVELGCSALLVVGAFTRLAAFPAALWVLAAMASWARVGTLGTSTALDQTLHAAGVAIAATVVLLLGGGRLSVDAVLISQSRVKRRGARRR